ncbi:potassium-transporting ATPase subunit KdpC [Herminiimonas fonticola]|uniref:Potassium-transporting ATPase KdpC subunit n=1 Tax=Herminiimonas fonticola TaxID=303380 RepID=A0A4R6G3M2_9BURK|nr:potassium-transporting ATPase subunit KdpC [Herminiimonas fonticola]RBA23540.1 kdpC: K+-transporting ATPase, C subunit [Herminiimonas fonticola]TDN88205.1 K+-transporting ATPase ATPase C chain [Herminiimonas fonticola]
MKSTFRPALVLFAVLTLICGVIYPYAITGIGKLAFSEQAEGSLLTRSGQVVGSSLIGQAFSSPQYFWGRPSATSPMPNNAAASSGSNQGPLNPALIDSVKGRIAALKAADPVNALPVPVDLVTASASGLDPEISLAAARYQAARIARAREMQPEEVQSIIDRYSQAQYFGFFGEPRVNVLALNLALDQRH